LLALAALVIPIGTVRGDDVPPPDVTEPPAFDEFLVIPLRVHILTSADLPDVDCHLSDSDIERIVGKMNGIWHRAGLHWGVESIVREPASRQARFRLARDLDGPTNLGLLKILIPRGSRASEGLNIYYIHKFAVNGVWLGDAAFVQETARLRPVEGGIDEPVPRVSAHELGHALGLPHRQAKTNLLASGTTGTLLNRHEVETARRHARRIKGTATVPSLRMAAHEATGKGDTARALRLWSWLAEIPGEGAVEARAERDWLSQREAD
jgi:hypothetical protein